MFKNKVIVRPKKAQVIEQKTDRHELVGSCVLVSWYYGAKCYYWKCQTNTWLWYMSFPTKSYSFLEFWIFRALRIPNMYVTFGKSVLNPPCQTVAIVGSCLFIPLWEGLFSFTHIVLYGCSQLLICVEKCQCFHDFIMINENKTRNRWNMRWLLYSKSLVAI